MFFIFSKEWNVTVNISFGSGVREYLIYKDLIRKWGMIKTFLYFLSNIWELEQVKQECANLRTLGAYVFYLLMCHTCLRAFVPFLRTCRYFFTCLMWLHFFTCLTCVHFFRCFPCLYFFKFLLCFYFHVPCVSLPFSRALIFLCAYVLFKYMLIKLTQINELTYYCSSLLSLKSVIYRSAFINYFHLNKTRVVFSMIFSFFSEAIFWKTGALSEKRNSGGVKILNNKT